VKRRIGRRKEIIEEKIRKEKRICSIEMLKAMETYNLRYTCIQGDRHSLKNVLRNSRLLRIYKKFQLVCNLGSRFS